MKAFALLALCMTGCAAQQPLTPFQQQMILMQMSRPAPQLQVTPLAPVNHRQITCVTNNNVTTCQ